MQSRLCLREPVGVFFTLLLAPLLLVLMGFVFGGNPDPLFGGRRTIDVNVPTYAAIVICMVGVAMIPAQISGLRDTGALRRFRATPLRPLTYIVGDVLVNLAVALLGISVLFLLGMTVYGVPFEGDPLAMLAGIFLSAGAFLAVGYALASLVPSAAVAQVLGNVLIFPMLFLSGTKVPPCCVKSNCYRREVLPQLTVLPNLSPLSRRTGLERFLFLFLQGRSQRCISGRDRLSDDVWCRHRP